MALLLVHSPLLGPSSWRRLAEEAERLGRAVVVPDLTGIAGDASPRWQLFVDGAVSAARELDDVVLVGHSGAGAMLPAIRERIGERVSASIFIDAVVPPANGFHRTPEPRAETLDQLTRAGRLKRWLDWWPDEVINDLLPDSSDRQALLSDMPCLPRAFYDEAIPVPPSWFEKECGYLQLSAAYEDDRRKANAWGWPTRALDSSHLGLVTAPRHVLDATLSLIEEVRRSWTTQ